MSGHGRPSGHTGPVTFSQTSAEADWPRHDHARWCTGFPGYARVLDLRKQRRASMDDVRQAVSATNVDRVRYIAADGLVVMIRQAGPANPAGASTWVLTLSPEDPEVGNVAVLVEDFSLHAATVSLAEYGIHVGDQTGLAPGLDAHLSAVHAGLLNPDTWSPGLATADLTDPGHGLALYDLLHLSHPRFPTHQEARALSVLNQEVGDTVLLAWADSDYTLPQMMDLAAVFGPDEVRGWLDRMDSAVAASWLTWGPWVTDDRAEGIAALAEAGWQPPTLDAAWPLLPPQGDGHQPTNATMHRLAALRIAPADVVVALQAGLSLPEIEALPVDGDDATDWATIRVMAALRDCA